jgi:hypothetical protein
VEWVNWHAWVCAFLTRAHWLKVDLVWIKILLEKTVKIIKKYLGKCFSSPRRLRGEKVPNVDASHLVYEM